MGRPTERPRLTAEHGAHVLTFDENRGLPAAIAAGYEYAAEHGYAYCGRVDADGQHPVTELRSLLELVRSGECDVAVGSRFATPSTATASRASATSRVRPDGSEQECSGARSDRPRPAVPRCDERDVRGERQGNADPRPSVRERRSRGRGLVEAGRRRSPRQRGSRRDARSGRAENRSSRARRRSSSWLTVAGSLIAAEVLRRRRS